MTVRISTLYYLVKDVSVDFFLAMAVNDDSWTGEVSGVLLCSCCNGMATAEWECNASTKKFPPQSQRVGPSVGTHPCAHVQPTYCVPIYCTNKAQFKN